MKKITIITELHDIEQNKSSTNIMTNRIIDGFTQNNIEVHLIGIVDNRYELMKVESYYRTILKNVHVIQSNFNLIELKSKYSQLKVILREFLFNNYEKIKIDESLICDKMLVMIPTIEAAFLANSIKTKHPHINYIQYWSDPYTLAGISRKKFGYKRLIQYFIECSILKRADKIIYFTEPLMKQQKMLFSKYSTKMLFIDGIYNDGVNREIKKRINHYDRLKYGYAGSYNPYIRNILPLYYCFKENDCADLTIIGKRDIYLAESKNIQLFDFIPQSEISEFENDFDVVVCLINHSTVQMPGKVFYSINTNKVILVILDGEHAADIEKYLKRFKRFEFCYNNIESIKKAIEKINVGDYQIDLSEVERLSPRSISQKIYNEFLIENDSLNGEI